MSGGRERHKMPPGALIASTSLHALVGIAMAVPGAYMAPRALPARLDLLRDPLEDLLQGLPRHRVALTVLVHDHLVALLLHLF